MTNGSPTSGPNIFGTDFHRASLSTVVWGTRVRGEGPWRWWDEGGEVEGEFVGARALGAGGMREGRLRESLLGRGPLALVG